MSATVHELTWRSVFNMAAKMPSGRPYGVPRGGAVVAAMLARCPADSPKEADFIVDDIIDSGRTRDRYKEQFPDKPFYALIDKATDEWAWDKWIKFPWEPPAVQDAEDIVVRMLEFIGEDPKRDGLLQTPARVVRSWSELFTGYGTDPRKLLETSFQPDGYDELVLLDNIEFQSTCEHHLLPFIGHAHLAYIPVGRIVGISKLARLVDCFARRLQIQERLTRQIADTMSSVLEPKGVAVVLEAKHCCMVCRGVQKQNAVMRTSAVAGVFKDDPKARAEVFSMLKGG